MYHVDGPGTDHGSAIGNKPDRIGCLRVGTMLDGHVLVLNRVFQAVQITSARRALTLLYKGQVKAVDSEYRTYDFDNWADIPV